MAKASLLGFLAWALPMQVAGTCLRCWPDAVAHFGYDAYLLLDRDSEATRRLVKIFLESPSGSSGRMYLERDHMEREAGNLFLHLENFIQRSGKDHERLLREAEQEKENFVKKLDEASQSFMKEICSFSCGQSRYRPYEVAHCKSCQLLRAPCNDPMVCAGPKVLIAVLLTFLFLLGIGGGVWYYRRKKKAAGEGKDQDEDDKESSGSSKSAESSDEWESSEESEEAVRDSKSRNVSNLLASGSRAGKIRSHPHYENVNTPHYENPPPFDIPSPPPFDIPSPPPFDIPSPPPFNARY
ncbi:testis-expressed protein 51 [Sceloporus undulatus]|uniref:testis-expressed protein 51 n=1 Tax=Sceloporus undulatus TaxID=8520 RepID=UPI001C4C2E52|nr:testis-expressed protein 51 [Sceloporus undulatus]